MKLSRLLLLVPAAGLLMTGCDKKEESKTLSSIAVSGSYQTAYAVGEELNKSGLVVTATYSDGSKSDVTASASFSGFSSEAAGSTSVTVSYEGKTTSVSLSVLEGYTFEGLEAAYAANGVNVKVPAYVGAAIEGEQPLPDWYPTLWWISGSTAAELVQHVERMRFAGWTVEPYEEADPDDPEVVYRGYMAECGRANVTIADFLADEEDPVVQFSYGLEPEHFSSFAEAAVAFYAENGVEGVTVPEYALASEEAYFEVDDSYAEYGYFDVYAYGSSNAEMEAYKGLLIENGWSVIGEADGDYRLQFGEHEDITVDLIDNTADEDDPYINISFYLALAEE